MLDFVRLANDERVAEHTAKMSRWVYESGPGFFLSLFGDADRAQDTLREWLCRPTSEFSGLLATVAMKSEDSVGMFIACSGGEIPQRRRADLLALVHDANARRHNELRENLKQLADLTAPVGPEDFYLRTIAVDASQRGAGIGRKLVEQALAGGEERQHVHDDDHADGDDSPTSAWMWITITRSHATFTTA